MINFDSIDGYRPKTMTHRPKTMGAGFVMSHDGGGLRGRMTVEVLRVLEHALSQFEEPISLKDAFDLTAGTSTGGLITLALNSKKSDGSYRNAQDLGDIYDQYGPKIFKSSFWKGLSTGFGLWGARYDAKILEDSAQEIFGLQKLADSFQETFVTTVDLKKYNEVILSSWEARSNPRKNYYYWEAARATSAAPTYFEASSITRLDVDPLQSIDGGIGANNPVQLALSYGRSQLRQAEEINIISLGTGRTQQSIPYSLVKNGTAFEWLPFIIATIMDQNAKATQDSMEKIYSPQLMRLDKAKNLAQSARDKFLIECLDYSDHIQELMDEDSQGLKHMVSRMDYAIDLIIPSLDNDWQVIDIYRSFAREMSRYIPEVLQESFIRDMLGYLDGYQKIYGMNSIESISPRLYRFDVELDDSLSPMDKPENLSALKDLGILLAEEKYDMIQEIAQRIYKEHHQRRQLLSMSDDERRKIS